AHRTPGATDNTSPRSRRSGGLRPPRSGPARPEHLSAATWRRSLQACIASLPLQSSLMSKTYLKSDHFNVGGSLCAYSFFLFDQIVIVVTDSLSVPQSWPLRHPIQGPGGGHGTETRETRDDKAPAGNDHRGSLVDRGSCLWRGC